MLAYILRWLVSGLATLVLLAGCSSVKFSSPEFNYDPPAETKSQPAVVENAPVSTAPAPMSRYGQLPEREPGVYTYGRFTVRVSKDGSQDIEGAVYTPPPRPPLPLTHRHTIFVDYTTKEQTYYRKTPTGVEGVVGYAVVTPAPEYLPFGVVMGTVTKIDTTPSWCPTPNIRKKYPDLPPGCLPFGHPENAMGAAKFMVDWKLPKALKYEWSTIRLHGAPGYPPGSFWSEETFGCVRLVDEGILNLIRELGPNAVKEGLQIVLLKKAAW